MENKINGMNVKKGNIDFVKAKLGFNKKFFTEWLSQQDGDWVNIDILESKGGDLYPKLNTWKPNSNLSNEDKSEINRQREMIRMEKSQQQSTDNSFGDFDGIDPENIPF